VRGCGLVCVYTRVGCVACGCCRLLNLRWELWAPGNCYLYEFEAARQRRHQTPAAAAARRAHSIQHAHSTQHATQAAGGSFSAHQSVCAGAGWCTRTHSESERQSGRESAQRRTRRPPRHVRAPAPTSPTCADPCADLAPTLPPTLPPTAANWRRIPWLGLPCAVCADRRRPAPTGANRPSSTSRRRTGCRVHHNAPPAVRGSPRRPYTHTTSDAEHFAEVLRSKERYVQEDEPVRIDD
jgi:hypothetical protein